MIIDYGSVKIAVINNHFKLEQTKGYLQHIQDKTIDKNCIFAFGF